MKHDGTANSKGPRIIGSLRSHASFLENLNERTDAFYKRIQNEITLVSHSYSSGHTSS
jgi:hypothetical protein